MFFGRECLFRGSWVEIFKSEFRLFSRIEGKQGFKKNMDVLLTNVVYACGWTLLVCKWKKCTDVYPYQKSLQEKIYPKKSEDNEEGCSTKKSLRKNLYQRILHDQFSTESFVTRNLHPKNPSIQGLSAKHLPKNF